MNIYDYFEENWNRRPYPVIDHSLRIEKLPDGTFHFYVHPSQCGGITTDFVVTPTGEVKEYKTWTTNAQDLR